MSACLLFFWIYMFPQPLITDLEASVKLSLMINITLPSDMKIISYNISVERININWRPGNSWWACNWPTRKYNSFASFSFHLLHFQLIELWAGLILDYYNLMASWLARVGSTLSFARIQRTLQHPIACNVIWMYDQTLCNFVTSLCSCICCRCKFRPQNVGCEVASIGITVHKLSCLFFIVSNYDRFQVFAIRDHN